MNIHVKSILSAIAFSLLFYSKSFGLNLVLISILVVILVSTLHKTRSTTWGYSLIYIASAVFVFLNPSSFTIFVYFMALMVFVGKSISYTTSLYLSWILGCSNLLIATVANYTNRQEIDSEKQLKKEVSSAVLNRLKGSFFAVLLLLLFGMLYKNANPIFNNLISEINLNFISIPWLFFTLLGYILFLNLLRPLDASELVLFDIAQKNELEKPDELLIISEKKKLESEHTLGTMIFIALNVLLIFFLTTDAMYLIQKTVISNAEYSESVHQGVYALMFSIVLAIVLILYFFRGNLNFYTNNQHIKSLTYVWIGLNILLIISTCYKNFTYIEALGLTYKRISVFVYLTLTLVGLITAYIKVAQVKTFVYLVRTNLATAFAFLIISAAIPWNKTITWFNLSNIKNPDVNYLIDLGYQNSEQLYKYTQTSNTTLLSTTKERIYAKYTDHLAMQSQKTWQEYTIAQLVKKEIK